MTNPSSEEPAESHPSTEEAESASQTPSQASETVVSDTVLALYVEAVTPDTFSTDIDAVVTAEAKEYINDLCSLTEINRRADQAEKALNKHVRSAAGYLRSNQERPIKVVADWCKWIGFAWVAFTFEQFRSVQQIIGQNKVPPSGSINWLVADVIITVVLLMAGFMIEKPLKFFRAIRGK